MGVLSEVFSARRGEVSPKLLASGPQVAGVPYLASNGVDPVKLATLQSILVGADLSDVGAVVERCPDAVMTAGEDGPWIYVFGPIMQEGLATADQSVGRAWAQTEEWQLEGWELAAFDAWYEELCALARSSEARGETLHLWMCL